MQKIISSFLFISLIGNLGYGLSLKGIVDKKFNSERDSVYVSLIWSSDESITKDSYNYEVGEIINGKFNFEVDKVPHQNVLKVFRGVPIAAAYIIVFKDIDGDKRFTENDKIIGLSEDHVICYAENNLKESMIAFYKTQKKSEPDQDIFKRFEKWEKGLNICKKMNDKKKKRYKKKYGIIHDILIPDNNPEVYIKTSDNFKKSDIKPPNWT